MRSSAHMRGSLARVAVACAARVLTNRFLRLYFCCLPACFASQRKLVIAHTDREGQIRVISARKATRREGKFYAEAE